MRTEFVLIDFENVQPKDLALLSGGSYKIMIFVGTHQTKIPVAMARALQAFGPDVEYVQVSGNGRNAADFHIAYYIGRFAAAGNAGFHVISKDAGFDPLFKHLEEQGVSCRRSISIADISRKSTAPLGLDSIEDKAEAVVANLVKRKAGKPRTLKTLRSTVQALFGKGLMESDLDRLIEELTKRGAIKIADGKVQYGLPE